MKTPEKITIAIDGSRDISSVPVSQGFDWNKLPAPVEQVRVNEENRLAKINSATITGTNTGPYIDMGLPRGFILTSDAIILEAEAMRRGILKYYTSVPASEIGGRIIGVRDKLQTCLCAVFSNSQVPTRVVTTPYPAIADYLIEDILPEFKPDSFNKRPFITPKPSGLSQEALSKMNNDEAFVDFLTSEQIDALRQSGTRVDIVPNTVSQTSFWMLPNEGPFYEQLGEKYYREKKDKFSFSDFQGGWWYTDPETWRSYGMILSETGNAGRLSPEWIRNDDSENLLVNRDWVFRSDPNFPRKTISSKLQRGYSKSTLFM